MSKKIYIGGTFGLFHYGHVNVFKSLKYYLKGEVSQVIVAVNSDDFAESYKRRPVMDQYERLAVVNSCKYVDYGFIMDTYENQPFFIEENNPDYIVMGTDWQEKDYLKQLCIDQEFPLLKLNYIVPLLKSSSYFIKCLGYYICYRINTCSDYS